MTSFLKTSTFRKENNKPTILRKLLAEAKPVIVIGAHNGLSGRIGELEGFDAIWASSFEISTSYGLPDNSLLSFDKYLEIVRHINNAVGIPVIVDCDSGFGDIMNTIRMAYEMERVGIAGISIEDNPFPKKCSLYEGKKELATATEHANRIKAIKATVLNKDFLVIARTEALIAGYSLEEALRRAEMYYQAGADAILVHSKSKTPDQVIDFSKQWHNKIPLVCVPTMYPDVKASDLYDHGYKMVIFANHGIRASIKAMKETLRSIRKGLTTASIEQRIEPVKNIFEIVEGPLYENLFNKFTE